MDTWVLFLASSPFLLFIFLIMLLKIANRAGMPAWTGFQEKTLWDFMNMLVVPITLGSMALVYGSYDSARQQTIEIQREEVQQAFENNRINESILQAYFGDISNLILEHGLNAARLENKALADFTEVESLARAHTLSTLHVLDGQRNGLLLRFLAETDLFPLLQNERLALDLQEANLSEYDFSGLSFNKSNLSNAVLVRTKFTNAYLLDVNFQGALLQQADFEGAALFRANFSDANLEGTNLEGAFYDENTIWSAGFDPEDAGAIKTTVDEWANLFAH